MDGSIQLTAQERKMLLQAYRSGGDGRISRRAHVVLLREKGLSWAGWHFQDRSWVCWVPCLYRVSKVSEWLSLVRSHAHAAGAT